MSQHARGLSPQQGERSQHARSFSPQQGEWAGHARCFSPQGGEKKIALNETLFIKIYTHDKSQIATMPKLKTSCSRIGSDGRVGGVYFFEDHDCIDHLGLGMEFKKLSANRLIIRQVILSLSGSHGPTRGL